MNSEHRTRREPRRPRRVTVSAGLWLTPPAPQRTNIIPTSQTLASIIASWPAPLGRRRGFTPTASTLFATRSCMRGEHGTTLDSLWRWASTLTPRRFAMASQLREDVVLRGDARRVVAGPDVEREFHLARDHVAGAVVDAKDADGADERYPLPACNAASMASTISAAAVSASWRSFMGTVPAWPASPFTRNRVPVATGDGGHDAQRQALVQQHRTLLDVQLEVTGEGLRIDRDRFRQLRDRARPRASPRASRRHRRRGDQATPGRTRRSSRGWKGTRSRSARPPRPRRPRPRRPPRGARRGDAAPRCTRSEPGCRARRRSARRCAPSRNASRSGGSLAPGVAAS